MSVVLQTATDVAAEEHVIGRIREILGPQYMLVRYPDFAAVDYLMIRSGRVFGHLELKIRKEPLSTLTSNYPRGLMLKARKIDEARELETLTNAPYVVVYAFDNGAGDILVCPPTQMAPKTPQAPPPRKKARPYAAKADSEEVVYLQWPGTQGDTGPYKPDLKPFGSFSR